MHQLIVARTSLDQLLAVVGRLTSPLVAVPPGRESVDALVDGEPIVVGEMEGLSYFLEDAGTVFGSCWGLLAKVACEIDALVIGSVFDPSEDHVQFFAASGP